MARLTVSLLGPPEVRLDNKAVTDFATGKARALLAYLAVEADRVHRRETLAALLWPDYPDRSARTNLRNALSNLRKAIGDADADLPCLLITRETIQLNRSCDCWIDVAALGELASARDATASQLEEAIALYRGPFLEGFSLGDSPAFEDWALGVRERMERQVLQTLHSLTEYHEGRAEHGRALECARRRVALAPWQEQAHRDLMRLLALDGRRGAALAQYEACRRALRDGLDVEPGEETRRLYERIRDGDLAPPRQEAKPPAVALASTPPSPEEPPPSPEPAQRTVPRPGLARPSASLEGERRIVTALLADVKGSTALAERIDTEDWVEIMDHVFRILGTEIYRYGGEVDQFRGDGLVAFFGLPTAHEDDPERAVLAALAMQEEVKRYAAELAEREGIELLLRVGVNTGQVIAATVGDRRQHSEQTAMGRAIAIADRMEKAAEPGTVLVSEDTYYLVAPLFEWMSLGEIAAKGVSQPVAVYRPLAAKTLPDKGRGIEGLASPLVGRDAEVRALREALDRLRSGIGGIVTVVGEAGIGKSRLVTEVLDFPHSLPAKTTTRPARKIDGRCLSYATTVAYQLWLDMLRGWLGVAPDAPPTVVRDALRERVRAVCADCADEVYPYLGRMMALPLEEEVEARLRGLDAEDLRFITFRAVEAALARTVEARPLVVVCEDLHWADPTSLELLTHLFPLADRVPVLFICVFRPEMEHGCWRVKEMAARDYIHCHTDLWLKPLSVQESATLVGNLLRVQDLPQSLRARILDHAEGNPFYVEEILRSLIDGGIIIRDEVTECWQATRDVDDIPIPDTLHGALTARIDRLQEETRRVLRLASVIGRVFLYRVLAEIVEAEQQLDTRLLTLQRQQLIRERARIPEAEYIFKHELTREAAYNGLLKKERLVYHRQVAETLERLFPDRIQEYLGLLAHHWECAEDLEKTIHYLRRAGQQAIDQGVSFEAISFLNRAADLARTTKVSQDEAAILIGLSVASRRLCDYAGATHYCRQALSISRQLGDRRYEGEALGVLGTISQAQGDYATARTLLQQSLQINRDVGDRKGESIRLGNLGKVCVAQGDYAEAKAYFEQSQRISCEIGDHCGQGIVLGNLGNLADVLGDYDRAQAHYEQARGTLCETGYQWIEGKTLSKLGLLFHHLGDDKTSEEYSKQALSIAQDTGYLSDQGDALTYLGHALEGLGHLAKADDAYQQSLDIWRESGKQELAVESLAGLGRVSLAQGNLTRAEACIAEILKYLEVNPELNGAQEPLRVCLTCYYVLRANEAPRAEEILAGAYHLLQERADKIDDEELRRSYLENVSYHREIVAEFRRVHERV